jgi:septum formation protein
LNIFSLNSYEIILASRSPRRKDFLNQIGFPFTIKTFDVEESFPNNLKGKEIADYIVSKKSAPFKEIIQPKQIIITADTIVWCENEYLGKPKDKTDAKNMLQKLSGKSHEVITAVGFLFDNHFDIITEVTEVHFKILSEIEIDQYVSQHNPLDKAGAYGIQDWIGEIGIFKINGSYTNVVGLPLAQVYQKIKSIIQN